MKFVPGKAIEGPLTMQGHTPQYKDNGLFCYLITLIVFFAGIKYELWNGGVLIDNCGPVIVRLNIFALILCFFLMYKGYKHPSTKDTKYSGDFFSDYFWGSELYPRLCFDLDIKVWTNCRMGMTMWPLIILSCWFYQIEQFGEATNNLKVNVILQMIYITKFLWWEGGYYKTIDIMVDCAGFYLCWGCLVWVPSVYTINSTYLAFHPEFETSDTLLLSYLILGIIFIYINYDIDNQRGWIR
jgi:7-dehydrocholesterol reductase